MATIQETAEAFFDACETGKGWAKCAQYCHPDAKFSAQSNALTGVETVEAYADWMQGLFAPIPDAHYDLKSFAVDKERQSVLIYAVFRGTNSGDGGPVEPTGNSTASDYVYHIELRDDKVSRMTKIWNDGWAMHQLGWG